MNRDVVAKDWRIVYRKKDDPTAPLEVYQQQIFTSYLRAVHTMERAREQYPKLNFILQLRQTAVTFREGPWCDNESTDGE